MTKSIKRNKTFKSKKNKKKIKGGATNSINNIYRNLQDTQQNSQLEQEDEIMNLFITLSETECTNNNSIILNSEDVNYLLTYIKTKKIEEKTEYQKYLENILQPINEGCKYVLDLSDKPILQKTNIPKIYVTNTNPINQPIATPTLTPTPTPRPRPRVRPSPILSLSPPEESYV